MSDHVSSEARSRYWKRKIDAWQRSEQSQREFCRTNELSYARFGYWLRKFREHGSPSAAVRPGSGFVPVVASVPRDVLMVRLPNGIELHGVTAENVEVVEQLLASQ